MLVQSTLDSPRPDKNERHHPLDCPLGWLHILRSTWYSPAGCTQSIPTSREAGFLSGQFASSGPPGLAPAEGGYQREPFFRGLLLCPKPPSCRLSQEATLRRSPQKE